MTIARDWVHPILAIPSQGLEATRQADEAQRAELAQRLGILQVDELKVSYRIEVCGKRSYQLSGALTARVVQSCVVTLDPVTSTLVEDIDTQFRDQEQVVAADQGEQAILALEDVEPIDHDQINVGGVVIDVLLTALDPYPRAVGARLEPTEPEGDDDPQQGPFAALAAWRSRSG